MYPNIARWYSACNTKVRSFTSNELVDKEERGAAHLSYECRLILFRTHSCTLQDECNQMRSTHASPWVQAPVLEVGHSFSPIKINRGSILSLTIIRSTLLSFNSTRSAAGGIVSHSLSGILVARTSCCASLFFPLRFQPMVLRHTPSWFDPLVNANKSFCTRLTTAQSLGLGRLIAMSTAACPRWFRSTPSLRSRK